MSTNYEVVASFFYLAVKSHACFLLLESFQVIFSSSEAPCDKMLVL